MELHLAEAIKAAIQARLTGLHTTMPGTITAYAGHETRLATVQPSIGFKVPRGPLLKLGPIQNVPVLFPSSNSFQFTFDIAVGDPVLLLFSEVGIGNWLNSTNPTADPDDSTRFSLHDAIAIPGLFQPRRTPDLAFDGDFLLTTKPGARVGATTSGTLDLSNKESSLRSELEALWDAVSFLGSKVQGLSPIAPDGPCSPDPAAAASIVAKQSTVWGPTKAGLERLLA